MRVLTISMRKGGGGKTVVTRELGAWLALRGRRVLLIAADVQDCLNDDVGAGEPKATLLDVLKSPTLDTIANAVAETSIDVPGEGLIEIIPYSDEAVEIESYLESVITSGQNGWLLLSEALKTISDMYDDVLIDCSPTLSRTTDMAMSTARDVYGSSDPSGLIYPVDPGQVYNRDIAKTSEQARTLALAGIAVNPLGIVVNRYYRKRSKVLEKNYEELSARSDCLGVIPDRVAPMSQVRVEQSHVPAVIADPGGDIWKGINQVGLRVTPTVQEGMT